MDGITFLQKIMSQHPIPVVMCSSLTEKGSETAMKALEYGAVEIIQKPRIGTKQFLEESRVRICDAVKAASQAKSGKISAVGSAGRPQTDRRCHDGQTSLQRHDPDHRKGGGGGGLHRRHRGPADIS